MMRIRILLTMLSAAAVMGQEKQFRTEFEVRYVATGAVYLSGGREEGLQEGFHLRVKRRVPGEPLLAAQVVGQVIVVAVAAHSAVCEIEAAEMDMATGDVAQLSQADIDVVRAVRQSSTSRHYAQVVTFTEGDPLEQELRDYVPRPPLTEVNRRTGRMSLESNAIWGRQSGRATFQQGLVIRSDVTRVAGTYWNLTGYWRGRFNSQAGTSTPQTLQNVLNRTYHLGLYYNNPRSKYAMGFGRLFVPYATSVNTIDGGYIARRAGRWWSIGAFGGSTPDPAAWDYKPGRQIGGAFVNFVAGSFTGHRYTSTAGIAMTRLHWNAEREYLFTENTYTWKNRLSVYHNMQADRLTQGRLGNTSGGASLSRSFLTVRIQATPWLAVDLGHNYLRNVPTFDTILLGTGLLDQYLFAGFSSGVRVNLPRQITVYANLGRSRRTGDLRASLNQTYGITFRNVYQTGIRADVRHSVFHSSFGSGWYQLVSFSRQFGEGLRLDVQAGAQEFQSPVTNDNRGKWANVALDWILGAHYVLNGGINLYRGEIQNYDQTFVSLGYRY